MTGTELESLMLSKTRQPEKDKYHMISLKCGIEETKQMSKWKKAREMERQTRNTVSYRAQTAGCQRGEVAGGG